MSVDRKTGSPQTAQEIAEGISRRLGIQVDPQRIQNSMDELRDNASKTAHPVDDFVPLLAERATLAEVVTTRPLRSYEPEIHLYDRPLPLRAELRKQLGRAGRGIIRLLGHVTP